MARKRLKPGNVRDTIDDFLRKRGAPCKLQDIRDHLRSVFPGIADSSIRSSLNLRTAAVERVSRALYRYRPR